MTRRKSLRTMIVRGMRGNKYPERKKRKGKNTYELCELTNQFPLLLVAPVRLPGMTIAWGLPYGGGLVLLTLLFLLVRVVRAGPIPPPGGLAAAAAEEEEAPPPPSLDEDEVGGRERDLERELICC